MNGRAPWRRQGGVTFIELVASIVIISVATLGLMLAVTAAVGRSADPMIEAQATAVARAYLEEISLAGFCDPEYDPDGDPATSCRQECVSSPCAKGCGGAAFSGEDGRASFDDVCDYQGLDDHGAQDRRGISLAELADYHVTVQIFDDGAALGTPALSADAGQVVRAQVTVAHPGLSAPVVLAAYKANLE